MKIVSTSLCLLGALAFGLSLSPAAVKLPSIFSDHMVLQSGVAAPVWGWASPDESVEVAIAGQTQTTKADAKGKWTVKLRPLDAGGPYTLKVTGSNTLVVSDVLAGEVWIGAGQSNMGLTVAKAKDYAIEKPAAHFPQIRMFLVTTAAPAAEPQENCAGSWRVTTPENIENFSAALYFFGRELHQELKTPVGLIKIAAGGTPIQLWIDEKAQRADPKLTKFFEVAEAEKAKFDLAAAEVKFKALLAKDEEKAKATGLPAPKRLDPQAVETRNNSIGGLFNSKVAPLIPYAISGVVWYQGETNAQKPAIAPFYQYQLPLLVNDWRKQWGAEFPFAWVQLANLDIKNPAWPVVREAMLKTLTLPKTGMAVAIDIGDPHDIHAPNKQDVGHRLAQWALGSVYGRKTVVSGPLPAGEAKAAGAELTLKFTHTDGGLVAKDGALRSFLVAGADKQWKPAVARIDGDTVIVSSPDVPAPIAARYDWAPNPDGNLYNGAGLPASPFRTDSDPIDLAVPGSAKSAVDASEQ